MRLWVCTRPPATRPGSDDVVVQVIGDRVPAASGPDLGPAVDYAVYADGACVASRDGLHVEGAPAAVDGEDGIASFVERYMLGIGSHGTVARELGGVLATSLPSGARERLCELVHARFRHHDVTCTKVGASDVLVRPAARSATSAIARIVEVDHQEGRCTEIVCHGLPHLWPSGRAFVAGAWLPVRHLD